MTLFLLLFLYLSFLWVVWFFLQQQIDFKGRRATALAIPWRKKKIPPQELKSYRAVERVMFFWWQKQPAQCWGEGFWQRRAPADRKLALTAVFHMASVPVDAVRASGWCPGHRDGAAAGRSGSLASADWEVWAAPSGQKKREESVK